jgi:hypothetical protein
MIPAKRARAHFYLVDRKWLQHALAGKNTERRHEVALTGLMLRPKMRSRIDEFLIYMRTSH